MITSDPNITRKQIFEELPIPSKVDMSKILIYIYTGIFIAVKLLVDIRLNTVKLSEGKKITTKHEDKNEKVE